MVVAGAGAFAVAWCSVLVLQHGVGAVAGLVAVSAAARFVLMFSVRVFFLTFVLVRVCEHVQLFLVLVLLFTA